MGAHLYHFKPEPMHGSTLLPLNKLKKSFPDAYAGHARKYEGRKNLMKARIPLLNCLWNDVLHFSTLDMERILACLRRAGAERGKTYRYYRIPVEAFEGKRCVYFRNELPRAEGDFRFHRKEFSWFDPSRYSELRDVPGATRDHFLEELRGSTPRPLLFARSPHVLLAGTLVVKEEWELSAGL